MRNRQTVNKKKKYKENLKLILGSSEFVNEDPSENYLQYRPTKLNYLGLIVDQDYKIFG